MKERYEITFKFNVPLAPHRNGLVERVVGSAKRALLHVIKPDADVNDEQLVTAFNMVETVLNSRPLTYVGSDFSNLEPLTPEHFLGKTQVPAQGTTQTAEDMHINFDKHFKTFRETLHHVMVRFGKEYGSVRLDCSLRGKWGKRMENLTEGAIITVFDSTSLKYWPLWMVTKAYRGQDGLMRTVKCRVASRKEYERDIRHVSLLLKAEEAD